MNAFVHVDSKVVLAVSRLHRFGTKISHIRCLLARAIARFCRSPRRGCPGGTHRQLLSSSRGPWQLWVALPADWVLANCGVWSKGITRPRTGIIIRLDVVCLSYLLLGISRHARHPLSNARVRVNHRYRCHVGEHVDVWMDGVFAWWDCRTVGVDGDTLSVHGPRGRPLG